MSDLLHLILWVFIFILGLSFFGISIQAIVNSPAGQANFGYLIHTSTEFWQWLTSFAQHFEVWKNW